MVSFYASRHLPLTKQVQTPALTTILSFTKGMGANSRQHFVNKKNTINGISRLHADNSVDIITTHEVS